MGRVTVGLKLFAAGLVLCLFVLVHPVFADNLASHFAEFARSCGVAAKVSSARLFSNPGKDRWKEYATAKNIPQPHSDWSEWAYVWMNPGSPSVVDVEGQGEDFSDGAYYSLTLLADCLR